MKNEIRRNHQAIARHLLRRTEETHEKISSGQLLTYLIGLDNNSLQTEIYSCKFNGITDTDHSQNCHPSEKSSKQKRQISIRSVLIYLKRHFIFKHSLHGAVLSYIQGQGQGQTLNMPPCVEVQSLMLFCFHRYIYKSKYAVFTCYLHNVYKMKA